MRTLLPCMVRGRKGAKISDFCSGAFASGRCKTKNARICSDLGLENNCSLRLVDYKQVYIKLYSSKKIL